MNTQTMTVTPELAASWLESNTQNRSMSKVTVERYANDMKNGNWALNHQGIAFDSDGVLVDGQHRLQAVVKSSTQVKMAVTWGASRSGVDELRPRSTHDAIRCANLSDWIETRHLQISRQMISTFSDGTVNGRVVSTTDILKFTEQHRDVIEFSADQFRTARRGVSAAMVKASVAVAAYYYPREKLADFVSMLYSGVVSRPSQSAVIRAREMLTDQKVTHGGGSERKRAAKRMTKAIDAFCEEQEMKQLREPKEMLFLTPK